MPETMPVTAWNQPKTTHRQPTPKRKPPRQVRDLRISESLCALAFNAREALRRARTTEEAPALVPPTWELVRASGDGGVAVLARGVVSFDLTPDGDLVYSNGSAVFRLDRSGAATRLVTDALIEHVVALPADPATAS